MNLPKQKKYATLLFIIVCLFFANETEARSMLVPENLETSTMPTPVDEPIVSVEKSSTTDAIQAVIPGPRPNPPRDQESALTATQQTRILKLAANISNRMDAAVLRLSTISQKLEQRIIKMEELSTETSLAREKLALANETLAKSKLKLSNIDTLVNNATFSTGPRNDWRVVREHYRETSSLIRQTHSALQESITALKKPVLKTTNPATGTSTTESEPILN